MYWTLFFKKNIVVQRHYIKFKGLDCYQRYQKTLQSALMKSNNSPRDVRCK